MSTSAQTIIDHAPLGALIHFSNGQPKPPARFTRKLRAWENENGTGRLTEKSVGAAGREGHFTLHLGDYGSGSVIVLSVRRVITADSLAIFTVEREPMPGEALVITDFQGRDELRHLARNEAEARAWLEAHRYSNARIDVAPDASIAAAAA